ncbi:MAG: DHH family phosphoesterase [Clostridia bacterium]|nr:DHH family phosphoesterase [Clostridia bacterium]
MTRTSEMSVVNNITIAGICKILQRNDNFLIFTHENPDADTIGSCFALVSTLRALGKTAYPACGDRIPNSLVFMTDGERDFHIEDAPADFMPEYYISVDVASGAQLGAYRHLADKIDLAMDHHATHDKYAKHYYIDPRAAACAEIVYNVALRLLSGEIPVKTASLLYAALAADTGGFRYANTTPVTHKIAAKLIERGANHAEICRNLFECKTKQALAAEAFAMANVTYFSDGKISYVKITKQDKKNCGFEDEDTYDVINVIRRVDGVKIAIFAREKDDGTYKISTRSACEIDVSKICAIFGGGGHAGAAGCSVSPDETESAVRRIIKECGFDD